MKYHDTDLDYSVHADLKIVAKRDFKHYDSQQRNILYVLLQFLLI